MSAYHFSAYDIGVAFKRKYARDGSKIIAPNMFHRNMNESSSPISAWNLIGESDQVTTPAASVMPVRITT